MKTQGNGWRIKSLVLLCWMIGLLMAGCSPNSKSPVGPARGGDDPDKPFLFAHLPSYVKSVATYSLTIDNVSTDQSYMRMYWSVLETHDDPSLTGLYRYGIGFVTVLPTPYPYNTQVNPYIGGPYGMSISSGVGQVTAHIFREVDEVKTEIATHTGDISGNGFLLQVTVY